MPAATAAALKPVLGRILDADSHEVIPAGLWPQAFGPDTEPFAQLVLALQAPDAMNSLSAPLERDEAELSDETADRIWGRGAHAPGSFDMHRRIDFLDYFGIESQLIFPTGPGLMGTLLATTPIDMLQRILGFVEGIDPDVLVSAGRTMCRAHNDWCIATAQISPRLRPVAVIEVTTIDEAIAEARRVIAGGVRAIALPSSVPPAGMSPGHPGLDPLWQVFTDHDVPVLLHVGGEFGLLRTMAWADYGFVGKTFAEGNSGELILDPYSVTLVHVSPQNFLTAMVFGGVFERHPSLRLGCIETGAHWVGPLTQYMDQVADQFQRGLTKVLSKPPSRYVAENVRVSAMHWEPVDEYIERYGLPDVFVCGSDYPHFEGGPDPFNRCAARLERLGPEVVEKFFVSNVRPLLPDSRRAVQ